MDNRMMFSLMEGMRTRGHMNKVREKSDVRKSFLTQHVFGIGMHYSCGGDSSFMAIKRKLDKWTLRKILCQLMDPKSCSCREQAMDTMV